MLFSGAFKPENQKIPNERIYMSDLKPLFFLLWPNSL